MQNTRNPTVTGRTALTTDTLKDRKLCRVVTTNCKDEAHGHRQSGKYLLGAGSMLTHMALGRKSQKTSSFKTLDCPLLEECSRQHEHSMSAAQRPLAACQRQHHHKDKRVNDAKNGQGNSGKKSSGHDSSRHKSPETSS